MATQTTLNTVAPNTYLNKTFYDRTLLEWARAQLVYAQFGQKRPIPRNNGKTVEFRRYTLFPPDAVTQKLTEGVTPSSQALGQTKVEATIDQYGAYVEISDLLDLTAYDPVIDDSAELLGEQLGIVADNVTRDAMIADASDQFAGGAANAGSIAATSYLTVDEVRKAVRTLKNNKARKFSGSGVSGHYVCIVDPYATYDLHSDSLWQDVSKYSNAEQIYAGEIGRLFGVRFVETTEGKVNAQSVLNAANANSSTTTFILKNDPTEAEVAYLSTGGNKIYVLHGGTESEYTLASSGSYTPATKTVTVTSNVTMTADDLIYSKDCGALDASTKAGVTLHNSLIFGSDAYGVIDVAGSGVLQTIIKPRGSAGTADPLDQRSTVGAKIMGYTAKVLNPLWIINIHHAAHA